MPRNRECDFCDADIEPGTGTMFVRKNGTTIHYCSSKCEKNHDLGRESRDLEWAGPETAGGTAEPAEGEAGDSDEGEPEPEPREAEATEEGEAGDTDEEGEGGEATDGTDDIGDDTDQEEETEAEA
jgi:large subunit ribosomal protein L24e